MIKNLIKPRYILIGVSAILSLIATKIGEKEEEKNLQEKVDAAIIDACIKVGMLEVNEEGEDHGNE